MARKEKTFASSHLLIHFLFLLPSKFLPLFWNFVLQYPVYFAFENDEIETVLADIKKNDAIGQPATATTGGLVDSFLLTIVEILVD